MGIPSYYKWLLNRFNAFQANTPKHNGFPVQHVYVDLNCFLHNAARRAEKSGNKGNKGGGKDHGKNKGGGKHGVKKGGGKQDVDPKVKSFLNLVRREIDGIVGGFDPRYLESIFIAVDGPASRAKVLLQRKRRR